MACSPAAALAMLLFVSYYNSVVSGADFLKDFGGLAGTMLVATLSPLVLGGWIRGWLSVTV